MERGLFIGDALSCRTLVLVVWVRRVGWFIQIKGVVLTHRKISKKGKLFACLCLDIA
jgi:hypothetical protein